MDAPRRRRRTSLIAAGLLGVAALGAVGAVELARPPDALVGRDFALRAADRVRTGHQRAERLAFADGGQALAVTCPRYNRVVIYRVAPGPKLTMHRDVKLAGRPVGLAASGDRLYVLQRPHGDARHVEPAWWDVLDLDGEPAGPRHRVGFDPDDLALVDGGRTALVLLSGNAEGETNRPAPSLDVVDLTDPAHPEPLGSVTFHRRGDDPERLAVGADGRSATVVLFESNDLISVDLNDRRAPAASRRRATAERPAVGRTVPEGDAIVLDRPARSGAGGVFAGPYSLGLDEAEGEVEVWDGDHPLGALTLPGFGGVRPTALAVAPAGDGALVAVSDRSGGVHLLSWTGRTRAAVGTPGFREGNVRFTPTEKQLFAPPGRDSMAPEPGS
jgi:glycerol-3-phosphate acyltransferase PlsY